MRVYVPLTLSSAAAALRTGWVPAGTVHAVTPALRERYGTEETEELELAALTDAAQTSLVALAAERASRGADGRAGTLGTLARRVVLAADAAVLPAPAEGWDEGDEGDEGPVPGRPTGLSAVVLAADLPWRSVVSAHVDEEESEPDVAAAVAALGPAGSDVRAASGTSRDERLGAVEDAEACDLLWYATSELPGLLEDLAGR